MIRLEGFGTRQVEEGQRGSEAASTAPPPTQRQPCAGLVRASPARAVRWQARGFGQPPPSTPARPARATGRRPAPDRRSAIRPVRDGHRTAQHRSGPPRRQPRLQP
jgi:hypothetical protein